MPYNQHNPADARSAAFNPQHKAYNPTTTKVAAPSVIPNGNQKPT